MRLLLPLLIAAPAPAFAATVESGHSGTVHPRTGPEPSDIALFACAAIGIWFVRRALRRRFTRIDR